MGDFIIVAVVISLISLIVYKGIKNKKSGNMCSGCSCSSKNCCEIKNVQNEKDI